MKRERMKLLMFSKMLKKIGNLNVEEAADYIAMMGFDGVDLTVRPGGHVQPEEASRRLPEAVEIFNSRGLEVPMITSNITSADEKYAEEIFKIASECNVRFIKLGYWRYVKFGKVREQIKHVRNADLKGICRLSEEYGVTAGLHIHSGDFLTSNPAVLYLLLKGYDPEYLCAYIDPGHMAVEGGISGWKIGMDILGEYVRMVAVKDFGWFREEDRETGEKRWVVRTVPLSEGLVPWMEVFKYLKQMGFDGPVSIHSEYHNISLDELIKLTRNDLKYLKKILNRIWLI